jgi:hypothetical protein
VVPAAVEVGVRGPLPRERAPPARFDLGRHGGKRENAGRPEGPNPKLWHRSRDEFSAAHPCLVTLEVRPEFPSLRTGKVTREIENAFRRACSRAGFRLVHYSIEDDHVHLIVEANGAAGLGRGMKRLAGLFAFAVNRAIGRGRTGKVLADVKPLAPARMLDASSSARWFDGWRAGAKVDRSPPPALRLGSTPAVAPARTWLLRVGWRRHQLIDPSEIPGGKAFA